MSGVLLDTHALYWLVLHPQKLSQNALLHIRRHQETGTLYVSPITAWELAIAVQKVRTAPDIGELSAGAWFRQAIREILAKTASINLAIAIEAVEVTATTGHRDPGDCYLIATARVKKLSLLTRDSAILAMVPSGYLNVIAC